MFGSKTLLALILFVLQFNCREGRFFGNNDEDEIHNCGCRNQLIDNSILFIIALYFICCCLGCDKKKKHHCC